MNEQPVLLEELLKILGLQGGTIWQALDEVKRLKEAEPKWLPISEADTSGCDDDEYLLIVEDHIYKGWYGKNCYTDEWCWMSLECTADNPIDYCYPLYPDRFMPLPEVNK